MTLSACRIFLGITETTWFNYKKREDFLGVIKAVEEVIRNQKIQGAAAGMLKENIIARELQLHDTTDHKSTDGTMTPRSARATAINASALSDDTLKELLDMKDTMKRDEDDE